MNKNDLPSGTKIQTVNTSAGGAAYVPFAAEPCTFARVHNRNSVDIEIQKDAAGATICVPSKSVRTLYGIDNMNRLGVRRTDTSVTQVPVEGEAVT